MICLSQKMSIGINVYMKLIFQVLIFENNWIVIL